jgi:hypothetical protein
MQPPQVVSQKSDTNNPDHVFGMLVTKYISLNISQKPTRPKRFTSPQLRSAVTETFTVLNIQKANTDMYRNTMYIPTITSWLHSQWHSYIAIKNRIVSLTLTTIQFSIWNIEQKIILSTEHQYKKITLLHQNKENSEKKQTQKQFFTVTVRDKSRDNYWNPKIPNNKFNLTLDIFMRTDVTQTANTALQRYSDFKQSQ